MPERPIVCDTTVLLYLGRVGQIGLLPSLFSPIIDSLPPNRLGRGEQEVIAHARAHQGAIAGLDDLRARQLAESLGLAVAGTLGLLLRAKRAGMVPAVRPLVDAVVAQGFHVNPVLYRDVLELAGETT